MTIVIVVVVNAQIKIRWNVKSGCLPNIKFLGYCNIPGW